MRDLIIINSDNTSISFQFKVLYQMYIKMNMINNDILKKQNEFELKDFKKVKYTKLKEAKTLNNLGESSIVKFEGNIEGTGFFMKLEQYLRIPINYALFTCNHIFPEAYFEKNELKLLYVIFI